MKMSELMGVLRNLSDAELSSIGKDVRSLIKERKTMAKEFKKRERAAKVAAKEQRKAEREANKQKKIEALLQRIERLQNPVGFQKMRAARRPGPVTVSKA